MEKMIEFKVLTDTIKQNLLKPIKLMVEVTNVSNENIEISTKNYEVEFIINGEKVDWRSSKYYVAHEHLALKPQEKGILDFDFEHQIAFQETFKGKKQKETFTFSLKMKFDIKGINNKKQDFIASTNTLNLEIDYSNIDQLLTPKGEVSKYMYYNNNVVYISEYSRAYEERTRKININKKSIKVLDRVYIIDDKKVFRDGNLQRINSKNFKIYNDIFAGNDEKVLTSYGDAKVKDPKSFEVFSVAGDDYKKGYARDKFHLYFFDEGSSSSHAKICKSCKNPASFKELYVKDPYNEMYGICERTVYINGVSISMADAKTWENLGFYSKDRKNVFYYTYKVKGADVDSFEIIKDAQAGMFDESQPYRFDTLETSRWGKDKNHYYFCGRQSTEKEYIEMQNKPPRRRK